MNKNCQIKKMPGLACNTREHGAPVQNNKAIKETRRKVQIYKVSSQNRDLFET